MLPAEERCRQYRGMHKCGVLQWPAAGCLKEDPAAAPYLERSEFVESSDLERSMFMSDGEETKIIF